MNTPRLLAAAALAGGALIAQAAPASAQLAQNDYGWAAWHGCWHADGAPGGEVLCIVPDGAGVRMITVVDGAAREESRVVADDRDRAVAQDDCRGTEHARWSNDHRRIFLNSELTCGQDLRRQSSGMLSFVDPEHWLSVQAVTVDGETATRSTIYTLTRSANVPITVLNLLRGDSELRTNARLFAAADVSAADLSEAARYVDDAVVQEYLQSSGGDYDVVAAGSALDQLGSGDYVRTEVVERPVYVQHTYVTNVVRSCWDPFFSGLVVGVSRHVSLAVGTSSGCGARYYSRYSPWGYGLFGWRAYRPVVFVNRYSHYTPSRGIIIRNNPARYRDYGYGDTDRYRSRDNDRYRGRDDNRYRDDHPSRNDTDRPRVTRNGYTQGRGSSDRGSPYRGTMGPGSSDRNPQSRSGQPSRIRSGSGGSAGPGRGTTTRSEPRTARRR